MAKIETDSAVRIVLMKEEVAMMTSALLNDDDLWIRISVSQECDDAPEMIVYLQGPNGEERTIFEA